MCFESYRGAFVLTVRFDRVEGILTLPQVAEFVAVEDLAKGVLHLNKH